MLAINAARGRDAPAPPWPRARPAIGLLIALTVIGYYGSKIGETFEPQVTINTDAPVTEGPIAEFVVESVTSRDFQIVVRTGVCTTADYSWERLGTAGSASTGSASNDVCANSHILTATAGERLEPGTDYLVTATFTSADGVQSSFEHSVTTNTD